MLKEALEQTGVARLLGWQDEDVNQDNIFQRAVAAALYPFQLLISPTAIKFYLASTLFLITSAVLLSISSTAYAFFYYNYIPQTDIEQPIYLQYGVGTFPRAKIPLPPSALVSQQPYDVTVILHMPRDPVNKAAGNFMLDLTLHGKTDGIEKTVLKSLNMEEQVPSSVLHHSRRPAILPYASTTTDLASKLVHLPLHLLSFHDADSVTLTIPMFEEVEFARGKDNVPTTAELEIQSQWAPALAASSEVLSKPQLHIYSAKLVFQVRFHGLRYLIYNHRILAFAVFTSLFYMVSISTLATVWALIAFALNTEPQSQALVKQEKSIKQEDTSDPLRTTTDYKSDRTIKRGTDNSENETVNLRENWSSPRLQPPGFTPQASEATSASASSLDPNGVGAVAGGAPDEHADDEEEESEDEFEQLARIRKKMEFEARQRQIAHDSGIGTSMESENTSSSGLVRRTSSSRRIG